MVTTYSELSMRVRLVFKCCLATKIGTMKHVEYGRCEQPKRRTSFWRDFIILAC